MGEEFVGEEGVGEGGEEVDELTGVGDGGMCELEEEVEVLHPVVECGEGVDVSGVEEELECAQVGVFPVGEEPEDAFEVV